MKIGLLSDTHGAAERTEGACALLRDAGAQVILHAGDVGGATVLRVMGACFQPLQIPVHVVQGNVDFDLGEVAGITDHGRFGDLSIGGKRLALVHGDDTLRLTKTLREQQFDFVITGHTHEKADRVMGRTRIINPGAVYRAAQPSVACLDLASGRLDFIHLPDSDGSA